MKIRKYGTKICRPQVGDLARPVPPAARTCLPLGCSFAASASWTSYLLVYFLPKSLWFLV